ncbi:hypothetical protein [Actinoplanes philippinensis]|uniref:hypothetical protein n=1 Tax=Actinoplanes philippinensis TaxID=35752 RepID=UPI00340743CD
MRFTRSVVVAAVATTTMLATTIPAGAVTSEPPLPHATETVHHGISLWHQRTPVSATPVTGKGATRADFDGDGRDDLAAFSNAGLSVRYSSAPYRDLLLTEWVGGTCTCLGSSLVTGNFNGDRYDDLVAGAPGEADLRNMGYQAGAVWVFPGGPGGLQVDRVQHFNLSTAGVPGASAEGDWFGEGLAAGDITGDGRDELAIGMPYKKIGNREAAGAVVVLKGSTAGVTSSGARWISQATAGVPGSPEVHDHFGRTLAIGRIDNNRYQDLVVGAPQEDDGDLRDGSGMITQFWGGASGISLSKVTAVNGSTVSRTLKQTGLYLWYMGSELAIGDLDGNGYGEIVAGAAGAQAYWHVNGGAVVTFPGRTTGVSAKGAAAFTQNTAGVPGAAEDEDRFGDSLAVGDVTGDGRADVLVGVPGEDRDAGAIVLLRGSAKGLTGSGSQALSQSSAVVPGGAERGDRFGAAVALLNLNGAGGLDAAIGSPDEQVPGDQAGYGSGTVTSLLGSGSGLGSGTVITGRFLDPISTSYGRSIAQ